MLLWNRGTIVSLRLSTKYQLLTYLVFGFVRPGFVWTIAAALESRHNL
jgi:hypothetical protein